MTVRWNVKLADTFNFSNYCIDFTGYLTGSRSHYWLANSLNYQLFIYQPLGLRDRPTEQLVNKMTKLVTKSTFERRPDWLTDCLFDLVTVLYFLRWLNWQFVWVAPTDWLRCFDVVSDFLLGQQTNKLFCWGKLETDWLNGRNTLKLTGWLTDWLTVWLAYWLI